MAAPTKTTVTLLSQQSISNNGRVVGSIIDLSGVHIFGAALFLARTNTTAHASPWAQIVVEGCTSATDNSLFVPIATLLMPAGASIAQTAVSGAVSAGATSFVVSSATNIAAGALLYVTDGTAANWEIVRVQSVSGTTINIDGAFIYSHANASLVSSQAERVVIPALDVTGISRARVACLNQSGQTVHAWASGITTVL